MLTKGEVAVLKSIRRFIKDRTFPPTVREVASDLGVSSSLVNQRIMSLSLKGFVRRDPKVARGIVLLRDEARDEVGA